jgi:hypothetical protein
MLEHMRVKNIRFSHHFLNDRQHRGICVKESEIQVLLEFAERKHDGRGAQICYFSEESFKKMKKAGLDSAAVQHFRKKKKVRVVISLDGTLITAMYANKSHQRIAR